MEGAGFKNLLKEIAPLYKVPSRNTIKQRILDKYDILADAFKNDIKNKTDFTLTTDIWSETMTMRSFLGVTIHFLNEIYLVSTTLDAVELSESHTSDYISDIIKRTLDKWGIPVENILAVVTDNDAKMLKAIQTTFGANKHISCFAHTINLTVENAIKASGIEHLITKVREIVKFFKKSTTASDELRKAQREKGIKEGNIKKLILDVRTRWNSSFYMINRFIDMLTTINEILITKPLSPPMLIANEIDCLKEITKILNIFEQVTVEASGQNYVTLSKIIPMTHCLAESLANIQPQNESAKKLKMAFEAEIKKRFGAIEYAHLLSLSTILDPRFKGIHHQEPLALSKSVKYINKLIKEQSQAILNSSSENEEHDQQRIESNIWTVHNTLVYNKSAKKKKVDPDCQSHEMSLYMNNPVTNLKDNPLQVWEDTKHIYPNLYILAKRYLSPVGTSVPSERLFSKASATITQARNRLSGKALPKLLFLGSLPDKYWRISTD